MKVLYTKYNRERLPQYQTETTVYEEAGVLFARKRPLNAAAVAHVSNIYNNYQLLQAAYKDVHLAEALWQQDGIRFEYIHGEALDASLVRTVLRGDKTAFFKLLQRYRDMVEAMGPTGLCRQHEFLGRKIELETMCCLEYANVDCTFDNVFLEGAARPAMIDYEWIFPQVPVKFVLFRSVYIFNHKYSQYLKNFVAIQEICDFFSITKEEIIPFEEMEQAFQDYVHGASKLYRLDDKYIKKITSVQDLHTQVKEKTEKLAEAVVWGNTLTEEIRNKNARIEEIAAWAHSLEAALKERDEQLLTIRNSRGYQILCKGYRLRDKVQQSFVVTLGRLINAANIKKLLSHLREDSLKTILKKIRDRITAERVCAANRTGGAVSACEIENDLRVTIVIPVYNNAEYLAKCIDGALKQTYEEVEVLAVDDCSTDPAVYEILDGFAGQPRFRWLKTKANGGISAAMNQGIIAAQGSWIAFLDCDDWLEPDAVEKVMQALRAKAGAVYAYTDRVNEHEATGASEIESFACRPTSDYLKELLVGMYVSHLKIIHKNVFLKIGLHESRFDGAQDYDIALKTAFHLGDTAFCYVPAPVYHHRIHNKQTTIEAAKRIEKVVACLKEEAVKRLAIRQGRYAKLVSLVILSFEKKDMTLQCVKAIQETVNMAYEIIIFDNASSPETVAFLKEKIEPLANVRVYYSAENLGCPGGRRQAVKMAKGDYVINLDNDIIVSPGWLEELIVRAESDEKAGAVCCKTVFPNGTVQFNGGRYSIDEGFVSFSLIDAEKKENDVSTALWHTCDWVPGGATLFKRDVLAHLDYSPGYVNAFEDNDISFQLTRLGRKMLNCPAGKVYHHHIILNQKQAASEKQYMKARYNNDGFAKSLITFYQRNHLIINDSYVHKLMGLAELPSAKMKEKIEKWAEAGADVAD